MMGDRYGVTLERASFDDEVSAVFLDFTLGLLGVVVGSGVFVLAEMVSAIGEGVLDGVVLVEGSVQSPKPLVSQRVLGRDLFLYKRIVDKMDHQILLLNHIDLSLLGDTGATLLGSIVCQSVYLTQHKLRTHNGSLEFPRINHGPRLELHQRVQVILLATNGCLQLELPLLHDVYLVQTLVLVVDNMPDPNLPRRCQIQHHLQIGLAEPAEDVDLLEEHVLLPH